MAVTAPKPKKIKVIKPKAKARVKAKVKGPTKAEVEAKARIEWFLNLSQPDISKLIDSWNTHNLNLIVPGRGGYDDYLDFFKDLSPNQIKLIAASGLDTLSSEAYAALSRWHDIIKSPHRIDKIHQATMKRSKVEGNKSIIELAQSNDALGTLRAIRDRMAEKLEDGAGARDTASLSRELSGIIEQIADLERKQGPKKGTKLDELIKAVDLKKRPTYAGGGARKNSFRSRVVTIDDTEEAH